MFEDKPYQIYLGDNVEQIQKKIVDNSIDLIVTSPPYDQLRDYDGFSFDFDKLLIQLWRIVAKGGVVMWNVNDSVINGSKTLSSFKQAIKFTEIGFKCHDVMIYEKGNFSNPSSNRYHQIFEYMMIFSKDKPKTFNPIKDKPIIGMNDKDHPRMGTLGKNTVRNKDGTMSDRGKRRVYNDFGMRTNIWRMKTAGQERPCKAIEHPAKMPNQMAHDQILSWSNPTDIVLDPFMGSGTTGIQALKLGRKFIGCEISQKYFDMSSKNLEDVLPLTLFNELSLDQK